MGSSDRLRLEAVYFSGYAKLRELGRSGGAILRFQHVRPATGSPVRASASDDITPACLNRCIRALRRWGYDIVSIDDVCAHAQSERRKRRFVCLTFDGGAKDLSVHAHSILAKHNVPFTVYLPAAFADGIGEAWWLVLEDILHRRDRISLVVDGENRHFTIRERGDRGRLYDYLSAWLRSLSSAERSQATNDLAKRYSVDLKGIARAGFMSWEEVAKVALDPNATIGTTGLSNIPLDALNDGEAKREIEMGRAVVASAIGRDVRHYAYPVWDGPGKNLHHAMMVEAAGFASAVSASPGWVGAADSVFDLPRLSWNARFNSLRLLRATLSMLTSTQ